MNTSYTRILTNVPYSALVLTVAVVSYFLGAIPWSLLVGKLFFRIDLRKEGSGNLGTTNAFRILGAKAGIAVLILDLAKGALAVVFAHYLVSAPRFPVGGGPVFYSLDRQAWLLIAAALAAIVGHTASPYIKFRGGKGAATMAGVMLALMPKVFVAAALVFIGMIVLTRYVSVGTLTATFTFPFLTGVFYPQVPYLLLAMSATFIVFYLHRANIKRLREGTEPRFSWKNRGQGKKS